MKKITVVIALLLILNGVQAQAINTTIIAVSAASSAAASRRADESGADIAQYIQSADSFIDCTVTNGMCDLYSNGGCTPTSQIPFKDFLQLKKPGKKYIGFAYNPMTGKAYIYYKD